jgi:hypothetical protein
MPVFRLAHFMAESHKQFVLGRLHYLNSFQMRHLLQQMLQRVEFTLTEFHLLCTLTLRLITKIIYTVRAVLLVQVKQVPW